ncbi:unnamed protein product [Pleuronectes platessa]|uniref:Uncharacterized protein n=1 Tax=Pleuronectes platessa TaxID=8262 RepID=A0A9N7TZQ7_PLEPL|nr:unnamed protein product [Pleuronectes platessa]
MDSLVNDAHHFKLQIPACKAPHLKSVQIHAVARIPQPPQSAAANRTPPGMTATLTRGSLTLSRQQLELPPRLDPAAFPSCLCAKLSVCAAAALLRALGPDDAYPDDSHCHSISTTRPSSE